MHETTAARRMEAGAIAPVLFLDAGMSLLCPDWRGPTVAISAATLDLLYANQPARDLLLDRKPIALLGNRLMLHNAHETRRFTETLMLLSHGVRSAMLVVDDEVAAATYALRFNLAEPAPGAKGDPVAIVELVGVSQAPQPPVLEAIAEAFGLTAAEGNVLALLAAGHSLREIAARRGVQIETVRHQCKAILGKMRCRRQADLVRLVAALSQPAG